VPNVVAPTRMMGNGDVVTQFVDSVNTTAVTYTYPKTQERFKVRNIGEQSLSVTVAGTTQTVVAGGKWEIVADFTSFSINALSGSTAFDAWADEKGLSSDSTEIKAAYDLASRPLGIKPITYYGGVPDGATDNYTVFNIAKAASSSNGIIYFPQNAVGNAIYYFATSPDLTSVILDADEGVILSFPSTNGTTFLNVKLRHNLKITSRDRNNTGLLVQNIGEDWLATVATGDVTKQVGIQQPAVLDATTFIKNKYDVSVDTVVAGVSTLTSTNTVTWPLNAIGSAGAGIIDAALTPARVGKEYAASFDAAGMTAANNAGRAGIIVVSGGEWTLFSTNTNAQWFLGTKATTVAWAETAGKFSPSGAYQVRFNTANMVISVRIVSSNIVEFYMNGVYITSRTMNGNVQYVGFAYNGAANSVGQCNAYDFISSDTPTKQNGNTLNVGIFGDSISFGEGSNYPWANLLGYILKGIGGISNVSISNYAVSGQTAAQQLNVLNTTPTGSFDYILILVGANDIQGQTSVATYKSNLLSMINKVRADGSIPILGVPPMFIDQASTGYGFATSNYGLGGLYRSAVYRVSAENNVTVADVLSDFGVITATNTQLRDNIHPQPIGDVYIARSFASAIMQARSKAVTVLPSVHREGANVISWLSAKPTDGYWSQGDVVYNTVPSVIGAAASQYTILGWRRITSGVGNVLNTDWVEMRNPTGT
jgi:lysophospholipase L1-like esterase